MATTVLTTAQASTNDSLKGVNVDPMVYMDWNVKTLVASAIAADIIETPVIDLNSVSPKCNRVVFHKSETIAAATAVSVLVSPDNVNWYLAAIYNGGVGGGTAISAVSTNELAMVALPSMRYVKGRIVLAAAISTQTAYRLALSLMRF